MNETVQQQAEQAVYVAPPVTLPMPDFMMAAPEPEPVVARASSVTPLDSAPPPHPVDPPNSLPPPQTVAPPHSVAPPRFVLPPVGPAGSRGGVRQLVGVLAIVLVLLVGIGVGLGVGRTSNERTSTTGEQGPATEAGATTAVRTRTTPPTTTAPTPAPTTPSPTPSPTGRPATPEQALALTDQQALDELNLQVAEARSQVAGLAGAWVPQVSSKCVGVSVDMGPDWLPDGVDDNAHVTLQQILAFHVNLRNRFGAVTLLPTQAGLARDQANSGPCAGSTTWMSALPERFAGAADANAWCAVNVPPVRECGARYFAGPGERSTLTLRR